MRHLRSVILAALLTLTELLCAQNDTTLLKVGDRAPNFEATSNNGVTIDLSTQLKSGKVVIIFYRGEWCPYCIKHLSNLRDSLKLITEKGANVILITSENSNSIEKTVEKTKATFNIIWDKNSEISNSYHTSFVLDENTISRYLTYGINLEQSNGNKDHILPVPATFIIESDGKIKFIHFNRNYKQRMPIKEILKYL